MAGAADGMMLFHRRNAANEVEYDSDVWDDTALIAAYDEAVAPLKARLAEHTGDASFLESSKPTTTESSKKKNFKRNKKKKTKQAKKKHQAGGWSVGDYCQAVYTEDGVVYEARICSIDPEYNTCIVRYLGYGNEEEQSLEDLIYPDRSARKQQRSGSVSYSETDSLTSQASSVHQKSGRHQGSASQWKWPSYPPTSGGFSQSGNCFNPMPPPPPPPPLFNGMPSFPPFSMPMPTTVTDGAASMPLPMMPPPPPPILNETVTDENEALCSMLLSWYMSGYHTGYYQGLKQGRKMDGSAAMGSAR